MRVGVTGIGSWPGTDMADAVKIAFQGPLSGDNVALGENMERGIQLAIDEANASGDYDFEIGLSDEIAELKKTIRQIAARASCFVRSRSSAMSAPADR